MDNLDIKWLNTDYKMSTEDRLIFGKTLCSLKGENIQNDAKILTSKIKYPRFLYRYRSVNNNSLAALMENKLFFSTPNYYDDPFYTFLKINNDTVIEYVKQDLNSIDRISDYANFHKIPIEKARNKISYVLNQLLAELQKDSFNYLREVLRSEMYSVCFTDTWRNETSWLKYADQHRGFAIVYDLLNTESCMCGKSSECNICPMATTNIKYYPIYYTDEMYNATEYAKSLAVFQAFKSQNDGYIYDLCKKLPPFHWEREKISLIKKKCHEYDSEWRGILQNKYQLNSNTPVNKKIKPYAIILGLRIQDNERKLVINAAKAANINTICQITILNDELHLQGI